MKAHVVSPSVSEPLSVPPVGERRQVHLVNPAAGGGRVRAAAERAIRERGGELLESARPGHLTELVRELFRKDPYAHAVAYGGDGTVFETVNGIMQSGASDTASFSVIPAGSGNDFSAQANDSGVFPKGELVRIDAVKTEAGGEVRYFANMMNIGFDCAVVRRTVALKSKPLFRGKTAYIAGVVGELAKKKTTDARIRLEGCFDPAMGTAEAVRTFEKKILLTAAGNGPFCGGGFRALPFASLTDGLLDVLVVNNVSRMKFVSLVGDYRSGAYMERDGVLKEKFRGVLDFVRCARMRVEGPEFICLDGEIFATGEDRLVTAEAVPGALWFAAL